jgi:short subunit fatty acids transporter
VGVDIPAEAPVARNPPDQYSLLQRLTAFFVRLFERYTPDPYILADMIQPFWALPVVAVAEISIRRVMGFTVMSFLVGIVLFGAALLLLA